jgi:competence ComEA-like helix-hairpin-helix protein
MKTILSPALLWGLCAGMWLLIAVDRTDSGDTLVSVKKADVAPEVHREILKNAQGKSQDSGTTVSDSVACININSATLNELTALPGVGPVIAGRIVEYRNKKGAFRKLSDVDRIKGIGPAKLKKLDGRICF